jgi:hypothetical protein
MHAFTAYPALADQITAHDALDGHHVRCYVLCFPYPVGLPHILRSGIIHLNLVLAITDLPSPPLISVQISCITALLLICVRTLYHSQSADLSLFYNYYEPHLNLSKASTCVPVRHSRIIFSACVLSPFIHFQILLECYHHSPYWNLVT